MLNNFLKFSFSLVILFHCLGITQLVSACCKDRSAFIGMVNMTEEETKKESESKEDTDDAKDVYFKSLTLSASGSYICNHLYFSDSKSRIYYQVVIENPTPPPDSLV